MDISVALSFFLALPHPFEPLDGLLVSKREELAELEQQKLFLESRESERERDFVHFWSWITQDKLFLACIPKCPTGRLKVDAVSGSHII